MKIKLSNLGALDHAEFTIGDFTIICGGNNTGKTYATYATYGFLDFWRTAFEINIHKDIIQSLLEKGTITINVSDYADRYRDYLEKASKQYSEMLFRVFAGKENLFNQAQFNFSLDLPAERPDREVNIKVSSTEKNILQIRKEADSNNLVATMLIEPSSNEFPPTHIIEQMISNGIKEAVFGSFIPNPFIASAERTGSTIFQKELDFTRNRIVDLLGDKSAKLHPIQLLGRFKGEYPIPVRQNVDFIRELPNITNQESQIMKQAPEILESFADIIGGEFKVSKDGEIQFIPATNRRIRLSLVESSSAVRSLLDIGFYLRHLAKPGDLLMVDEPELNLHPSNQRRVARLFASLVNLGIKVFITTHSDYIVKEINTLIMLSRNSQRMQEIADREKYRKNELITADKLKVYIAEKALIDLKDGGRKKRRQTLVKADISPEYGIDARSFDTTIDDMNRIQEEIVWGGEENE